MIVGASLDYHVLQLNGGLVYIGAQIVGINWGLETYSPSLRSVYETFTNPIIASTLKRSNVFKDLWKQLKKQFFISPITVLFYCFTNNDALLDSENLASHFQTLP